MTPVTITRTTELTEDIGFFCIEWEENGQSKFKNIAFREKAQEDSIYFEETNKKEALRIAKIIEETGSATQKEIIYQTP